MRITIGQKLALGFGSLMAIFLITGLVVNANVRTIEKDLKEITEVEEPTSAAAYEMEINVIGAGLGVLKYLDTGDPKYRSRVEKDQADFERFKAQYDRLAETPKGKELGKKVGALYLEFKAQGDTLMDAKDRLEALVTNIAKDFTKLDDIIDDQIRAKIDLAGPDGPAKWRESALLEADVAEVGTWLGAFLRTPKIEYRERMFVDIEDMRRHLERFANFTLTSEEKKHAGEVEALFNETVMLIQEVLGLSEDLQKGILRFIHLREQLNHLLDEEIQVLTHKGLNLAKDEAHNSVSTTRQVMMIMLIIGLLVGGGSAVVIGRGIAGPLRELVDGADRVGRGQLDHRIEVKTKDEIGDLADAFNQMTEKRQDAVEELALKAKELEESNAQLSRAIEGKTKANKALLKEVAERERVEKDLRQANDVLQETRRRLSALIESSTDAIISTDSDGKVVTFNQGAEALLGYKREEANGRHVVEIYGNENRAKEVMRRMREGGGTVSAFETVLQAKDGDLIPVLISASILYDEDGKEAGSVGFSKDLRERKRAIEELQQTHRDLQEAYTTLERAQASAIKAEKLVALGRLTAGVSHEILNPLAAINIRLHLLINDSDVPPEVVTHLREVEGQAGRITKIVRDFLSLARHREPESRPIDFGETIRRSLVLLTHDMKMKNIEVDLKLSEDLPTIMADADQLQQVILNLLTNARDAMPDGGRLSLITETVETNGNRFVELRVKDTGPGIPPKIMEKIFDPFFTTKPEGEGTGLGLPICKGIVEAHGGSLRAENGQDGAVFVLHLGMEKD